jgi:molecular chaperone IbpA
VLHRGIATRAFKQTFNLAGHMKVTGATLDHGLLIVDLKREVPEALKPRRIDIASLRRGTPPSRRTTSARRVVRL